MLHPTSAYPRWDNYPAMIAACLGPVFVGTAMLQSCFSGLPGSLFGSVTAAVAVAFLVSIGNSSITTAQSLYQYNSTVETHRYNTTLSLPFVSCTLAGSVLCSLAITFLLFMWEFYQDPPREYGEDEQRSGFITLHDDQANDNALRQRSAINWKAAFSGYARKIAVPCIFLAFLGWCVLVGGHHWRINSTKEEGRYNDDVFFFDFGQWGACVATPLLLLFGLLHAGCSGSASAVMGVVNATLNGLVLTSIGYYLVHDVGGWLKRECEKTCDYTLPQTAGALCEIVGSFVFCFFWASVLALWPFYKRRVYNGMDIQDNGLLTPSRYVQRDIVQQEEENV